MEAEGSGSQETAALMPDNSTSAETLVSSTPTPSLLPVTSIEASITTTATIANATISITPMLPSPTTPTPATTEIVSSSTTISVTESLSPSASTSSDGTTSDAATTTDSSMGPIVGVAIGCAMLVFLVLLLAFILLLVYYFHSRYNGKYNIVKRKKNLIELEERGNGSIINTDLLFAHLAGEDLVRVSMDKLHQHVDELAEDDGYKAEEEYNAARELDPEPNTKHASLSCNEPKNRYINILARDDTRVILRAGKGSDYINANYIEGFSREREYIACQGPLPDTVIDFWKMVWEQNTGVIVMVTNPSENGMVKCETYWPPLSAMQYGNYQVKVESEMLYPEFIIRQFTLVYVNKHRKEEGRHSVTQFHFTSWPDFGVPQDSSSMLKFVRCIRSHMAQNSTLGPMVVHCSAGVGRTGTFIAIDILTQKIDEAKSMGELDELKLSVQEVVCKMRAQRGNMVQTSAQYLFIYNSLLRVFTHGRTDVKEEDLKEHVAKLTTPISGDSGKTWLDKEFQHVMNVKFPPDSLSIEAYEDYNESKNRDMENIPFDHNRVLLEGKGDDEEDYINASYIDGYYNRVEFISTEHPLQHTRTQFWTMLVERSIDIIIVFGQVKDPEDRYWPEEKEVLKLDDDLTIVGEEVEKEDEEEEEKGREGDTEEESEEKKESQASGGTVAEGASSLKKEEKSPEKKSENEIVKVDEGSDAEKEKTEETEKEKAKGDDPQKVEEKEEERKKSEEESKQGEQEPQTKEEQKVGEEKKEGVNKADESDKTKESGFTEKEKATDILASGAEEVTDGANNLDSKEKQGGPEEEKMSDSKEIAGMKERMEKVDKENLIQSAETQTMEPTGTVEGAKLLEPATVEGSDSKNKKTSSGEKEVFVVVRNFTVTLDETAQPVKMYHVVGWPSEGTPDSASSMLQLVQRSRDHWKSTGFNSILLHTATGVKDEVSGVYCGLCVLLRMLQIEQEIDMVTTMERLRQQRPGILRNKDFYMFTYKILEKAVNRK